MARSLGTLTLDLIAKTGGFTSGLSKAEREAKNRSAKIQKSLKKIGPVFASVAAAVVTSSALIVNELKNTSVEIDRLSRLSGANVEEFQKLAYASDTYKISNEKLADILKDVNDKIGDFIQDGGGPLKSFFENIAPKIGVTADEFARLSGPQALQLYVDSLERANLSQKDMTFYMEAIANDATLLLPLLSEQGKRYKELADQADRYGVILSEEVIRNSILLERQFKVINTQFTVFKNKIGSEVLPTVTNLAEWLSHLADSGNAVDGVIERVGDVFDVVSIAGIALTSTLENVGRALVGLYDASGEALSGNFEEAGKIIDDFTIKNEESVKKAEQLMSNIWNDVSPDTSGITTANDQIENSFKNISSTISEEEKKSRDSIRDFIAGLEEEAATLGFSSTELDLYKLSLMGATDAQIEQAKALRSKIDAYEESIEQDRENEKTQDRLNMLYSQHTDVITGLTSNQLEYNKSLLELTELANAGKISQEEFATATENLSKKLDDTNDIMADFGEEAAKAIQSEMADFLFDPFSDGLDGMADSFAKTMQRMLADAAAAQIMESAFGSVNGGEGWLSTAGSAISSYFGGGRANGGPVMANGIYEFGEQNIPEVLTIKNKTYLLPGNNGNVTSTKNSSSTQVFNITTPNADSFRKSERQIKRSFRSNI